MMLQTIANDNLTVTINETGAELWSIRGETEYLWQGDPKYWAGRALTIFPYVARLNEGKYTALGELYRLPIHGFANQCCFSITKQSKSAITFALKNSSLTLAMYPYAFMFQVRYALNGNRLDVMYGVENTGKQTMYFGLGGHPGFNVPLEKGLAFADYALRFDAPCKPKRIGFTDDCLVTGESAGYPLESGTTLRLSHGLFDHDAIVLKDMAQSVTLRADKGRIGIRVSYPQMPYLGIWHRPCTDAPYVCIEPWSSLPAAKGVITELSTQPDLIALQAGKVYHNKWTIEIVNT